jgi:hypothetical protein
MPHRPIDGPRGRASGDVCQKRLGSSVAASLYRRYARVPYPNADDNALSIAASISRTAGARFRMPAGPDWVHEITHDGYRLQVRRNGDTGINRDCCIKKVIGRITRIGRFINIKK